MVTIPKASRPTVATTKPTLRVEVVSRGQLTMMNAKPMKDAREANIPDQP
jgi:hypothetical protein